MLPACSDSCRATIQFSPETAMPAAHRLTPLPSPTRRRLISNLALTGAGLLTAGSSAAVAQSMQQLPSTAANQKRTSLHDDVTLPAPPARVYAALLDAKQFAAFTTLPAEIDPHEGGAFTLFAKQVIGRNIQLLDAHRIVQAWRPEHWDPGIYSIARFELKPAGDGTAISFDHTGFPEGEYDHLEWGWHNHYWLPLTHFLS
jgi:activator of HSP90 ATPase